MPGVSKMRKFCHCILAISLSLTILLQQLPVSVLADDSESVPSGSYVAVLEDTSALEPASEPVEPEAETDSETAEITEDAPTSDVFIQDELSDERSEYSKHFRLTDGTFTQVHYGVPVHYEVDGQWLDIDNTLKAGSYDDGSGYYFAQNGSHSAVFSGTADESSLVILNDGDYSVSLSPVKITTDAVENIQSETAVVSGTEVVVEVDATAETEAEAEAETETEPNGETNTETEASVEPGAEAEINADAEDSIDIASESSTTAVDGAQPAESPTTGFNSACKAEIINGSDHQAAVPKEMTDVFPEALIASVTYRELYPGIDLQYELFSYNLKESIVLSSPDAVYSITDGDPAAAIFSFILCNEGCPAELTENGTVLLYDGAYNLMYTLPAPVMTDCAGAVCYDIAVELTETEVGYLYTLTPDPEWLASEERSWPVTIKDDKQYSGPFLQIYRRWCQLYHPL